MEKKRLFFGIEVEAPWPTKWPEGRLVDAKGRHMTLAFLGHLEFAKIETLLGQFPQPDGKVGRASWFDKCLFLPKKHARVVAWNIESVDFSAFAEKLITWLQEHEIEPDVRHPFTPHVTICRAPFDEKGWRKSFSILPVSMHRIHLYESVGNLHYVPLWSYELLAPFEELDHTADLGFFVRAESWDQMYEHALSALGFNFPPILLHAETKRGLSQVEDVIIALNQAVSEADLEVGCPFKAVSFHTNCEAQEGFVQWEMIVDV